MDLGSLLGSQLQHLQGNGRQDGNQSRSQQALVKLTHASGIFPQTDRDKALWGQVAGEAAGSFGGKANATGIGCAKHGDQVFQGTAIVSQGWKQGERG